MHIWNLMKEGITSMFTYAPWKVKVPHSETSWSDFCLNMTRSFFYWSNFFLLHILIWIQTDFSRCAFFALIFSPMSLQVISQPILRIIDHNNKQWSKKDVREHWSFHERSAYFPQKIFNLFSWLKRSPFWSINPQNNQFLCREDSLKMAIFAVGEQFYPMTPMAKCSLTP